MIFPPAMLGVLGGGQLGRFFVMAAHELGYRVAVLDPDPHSPAGRIADLHIASDYDDTKALAQLADACAAATTEFENVPAAALRYLAARMPVRPGADALGVCQNRSEEKAFLRREGFAPAPCVDIRSEADLDAADAALFPAILKAASFGYDGKGQASVADAAAASVAWRHLGGRHCVLEQRLHLDCEISVVLARGDDGDIRTFPCIENRHRHGILDISCTPARVAPAIAAAAEEQARAIAEQMHYVGVLAVEFFVVNDKLYVNEMAPRPHNSGHLTMDACLTNQFEQQVRALCGLPLGQTRAHDAAVMVNLLGDLWFDNDAEDMTREPDWGLLLATPGLKLHQYGKIEAKRGRKMGHFTVVGEQAHAVALKARAAIGVRDD